MRLSLALSALVASAALALPAVAHADTLDNFSLTGNGISVSFSLPSSPTPTGVDKGFDFYIGDLTYTYNGVSKTASDVYFYNKSDDGGFALVDANEVPINGLSFTGPALYTGNVNNPTFKTGDFTLQPISCQTNLTATCKDYSLTITAGSTAATPEPGSLALLGTGALGAFGILRRRFGR